MTRQQPRARSAPSARTAPVAHKVRGGQGVSGKNATGIGRRVPVVTDGVFTLEFTLEFV